MPQLAVDHREFGKQADRLLQLLPHISSMPPSFQKMVIEIIMLRLFSLLESTLQSITLKVLCGTHYLDLTNPALALVSPNSSAAIANMQSHGRTKPHYQLRWTRASEIKENVKHLLNPTDNLITVLDSHGQLLDEMRRVRNRIAHNNADSRRNYRIVVRQYYGAFVNTVTPGVLLGSNRHSPLLIEQYARKSKIVVKEIVKA